MTIEEKLQDLGYPLPQVAPPVASYVPAVRSGSLIFTSGQIPTRSGELIHRGSVGSDVTPDEAYECARTCALNALAAVKSLAGDLDQISRVVRVVGYVSSASGFTGQPTVINGASDLLLAVFGDAGKHARTAVGVSGLPLDAPVEVELMVEVRS
jgi:enamine deaminase RidA (YjgF/YER057c/UK114 family)